MIKNFNEFITESQNTSGPIGKDCYRLLVSDFDTCNGEPGESNLEKAKKECPKLLSRVELSATYIDYYNTSDNKIVIWVPYSGEYTLIAKKSLSSYNKNMTENDLEFKDCQYHGNKVSSSIAEREQARKLACIGFNTLGSIF